MFSGHTVGSLYTALGFSLALLLIALAVAAMVLRAACKMTGQPSPDLGRAIIIVVAAAALQFIAGIPLGLLGVTLTKLLSIPVSAAASAFVYSRMLPTTFARGLLIWLAQIVFVLVVIFLVSMAVGFIAASMR